MIGDIKHIIVIQSLKKGEIQTGYDLYNDCIKRRIDLIQPEEIKMTHHYFDAKSKDEFNDYMNYCITNSLYMPGGMLMHFEMHGSENLDGLLLLNNELISWLELISSFRKININCNNNLFLTMATCHGRFLYKAVCHFEKSPYSGYISASKEVSTNEIARDFEELFEKLIDVGNIINAYLELEKKGSNFYYKDMESTLLDAIKISVNELMMDENGKKEVLKIGIENAKKVGEIEPTEEVLEIILSKVIDDIYIKFENTFMFR